MSSTVTVPGRGTGLRAYGQLRLRIARTVAEVEEFRGFWEPWQDHPNSVIDSYLAQFAGAHSASQPYVLALYRGGKPDCLLIGKQLPRGIASAVSLLLQRAGRVFYFIQGGLLGNPSHENCQVLIRAILAQLRHGRADAAEFYGLRRNSSLYRAALEIPGFFCRDHFPLELTHRYLLLPGSFQEFLSSLPAKERENIKYRERRLMKAFPGEVRLCRFRSEEDDVERLIHDAEEIAKTGYQRAVGRGFNLDEGGLLRVEARNRSLRGYVLYVEGKPCAYLIASWQKGVLYGAYLGHNPKYDEYALGRFLLMRCIEDCFAPNGAEKTVLLDPGIGDQDYKRLFTNVEREEAHVTIHAPTVRGAVCNAVRTSRFVARLSTRRLLAKSRLLPLVLKLRRRRALKKALSAVAANR
jgi:hypothetical protein